MPTISEINHEIMQGSFSNDQLNSILMAVRYRRRQIGQEIKRTIRVGDTVCFYHPKLGINLSGPVRQVMIKNIVVETAKGRYRVPANLLEVV
jgi:hypothetical protein